MPPFNSYLYYSSRSILIKTPVFIDSSDIFMPCPTTTRILNAIPLFGSILGGEKYQNIGREKLFGNYFGTASLSDSMVDLLIPAVDENYIKQTYLFTSRKARSNPSENYRLFDAVMATSSAPTYFPIYRLGKCSFIDGGINNNPSELACNEALSYGIDERNVTLISLGTGDCISDPVDANTSRSNLFWARNLHRPALDPQTGNVDDALHNRLGDRYQRWQCWLEKPIAMDDCRTETISRLVDLSREYIEEMDESEENPINKVVDRLLKPKLTG